MTGRNASATLAFHQFRQDKKEEDDSERKRLTRLSIETEDGKFRGKLYMDVCTSFTVLGPKRGMKPSAIQDAIELGRIFLAEGAEEARRLSLRLARKSWTDEEIEIDDEADLTPFLKEGLQRRKDVQTKLIPPGEGWVRFDEMKLVNQQSQVFFVQVGKRAGQYLQRESGSVWTVVDAPHQQEEHALSVYAATASWVNKGAKLDRVVLLNDITKIARLALKFPLSFVDLPACAYALLQGQRSPESAQACAENFHKKLLPMIAEKIHTYSMPELEALLRRCLEALDADLMRSAHAFSGVCALVVLVLGNRVALAGVGHVRALLIPERGPTKQLLRCTGSLSSAAEVERMQKAGGIVKQGILHTSPEGVDDACRILAARHAFDILQIEPGGPSDEKQVRSAYRKLALRVHPDKQTSNAEVERYKAAFERLEGARDGLEALLAADALACRELHQILRCSEVHTRAGAAELLGVDKAAIFEAEQIAEEAEKSSREILKKVSKLQGVASEYDKAVAVCQEAVATLSRPCAPETLPRQEALLKEGLSTTRAMGARDMRLPYPVTLMEPESASCAVPSGRCLIGLLCGATAALEDDFVASTARRLGMRPKAAALRCCLDVDASASSSSSAVFVKFDDASSKGGGEPPGKRARTGTAGQGAAGGLETVRLRHILFKHQQLRQPDPMARREGSARTAQEAEKKALETFEKLLQDKNQFLRLCRELSDCQSADQPGMLAGDLNWVARGQLEQSLEDVAFSLKPNDAGDLVVSSRGVHILQRLG